MAAQQGGAWSRQENPAAYLCQHDSYRYAVVASTSAGALAGYRIHSDGALVRLIASPRKSGTIDPRPAQGRIDGPIAELRSCVRVPGSRVRMRDNSARPVRDHRAVPRANL